MFPCTRKIDEVKINAFFKQSVLVRLNVTINLLYSGSRQHLIQNYYEGFTGCQRTSRSRDACSLLQHNCKKKNLLRNQKVFNDFITAAYQ